VEILKINKDEAFSVPRQNSMKAYRGVEITLQIPNMSTGWNSC
jgi:hypothetical protein